MMTVEQATALIVAVTGLLGAMLAVLVQLRQTHALLNSKTDALLRLTESDALARGRLAEAQSPTLATATQVAAFLAPKDPPTP